MKKKLTKVLLAMVIVVAIIVVTVQLVLKNRLTEVLNAAVMPVGAENSVRGVVVENGGARQGP